MAQITGKKVATTPVDPEIHGQIIDSMTATTDKTTNAPSIRMALSNGVPAGSVIDYEGETVPDGYIRRDDIPTLSELNDKLNNIGYTASYSNTVAGGSTNTWVDLISVPNLQNGVYMVTANVECSKNLPSTLGRFSIAKNDSDAKILRMKLESGGGGFLSYIFTINNANDAIKLKMFDNIDNTASYIAYMVICRIK